ncbi:YhgE/Pip family protein [Deinococcus yunweiensis]|uniref:YhgE/Pip family protein n=1 Tax=Deinococcus yunweiensis TaxID=367282 RepID=UPI00398E4134
MPSRAPFRLHTVLDDYRRLSSAERRLWRWPMMWVSAAAITAVPLAYATIYLSSALDPYGHLENLPVALVDLDAGTVSDGTTYRLGREVVRDLTRTPSFRYTTYPTEQAAHDAVRRGDAYFALVIPKTFSAQAVAGSSADHGTLNFYVAEGSNYFASRVAATFASTLADDLNATLGETRWTVVQRTLAQAQRDLTGLRDATGRLTEGASQLKIGTRQLAYSAGTLATGARSVAGGGRELVTGATELSGAVTRLTDGSAALGRGLKTLEAAVPTAESLAPLTAGTARVASGAGTLAGSLDSLAGGAQTVAGGARSAADGARQLAQGTGTLATTLPDVQDGVGQLAEGAGRLAESAQAASSGAAQLATGSSQIAGRLPALQITLDGLSSSATQLAVSASRLDTAARQLTQPVTPLSVQLPALNTGVTQATASARQFAASASTFSQTMAAMNVSLRSQLLVPQVVREDVATLTAQAERVRTESAALRTRLEQLGTPLRRAVVTPVPAPASAPAGARLPGVGQTSEAATDLATALTAARDSAASTVQAAGALESDATRLAETLRDLAGGADTLATQAGTARSGLSGAVQGAKTVSGSATSLARGLQDVQQGAATLADRTTQAAVGARSVQTGAATVQTGVTSLVDGIAKLRGGLGEITGQLPAQEDLNAVRGGARTLAASSGTLGQGLNRVATGADKLQAGADDVNAGAGRLLDGLTALQARIPTRVDALTGDPQGLSVSVKPDIQTFAAVKNNGAAFAPYFMALSLWVGVTLTTFIFPYQQLPRSGRRSSQLARVLRKAAAPAVLVTVQALLVVLGVHLLGVDFLHPGQVVLTAVASSMTFLMMVLALIVCFGAAGRLLALILLVLQLAASGGSYPVELAPRFYQVIHDWLPVTQSVGAFRHALSGAFEGHYPTFMLTLLALFAGSLAVSQLGRRRWEFVADQDFRPLISAPITSRDVPPDPYIDAPSPEELKDRTVDG